MWPQLLREIINQDCTFTRHNRNYASCCPYLIHDKRIYSSTYAGYLDRSIETVIIG